MGGTWGEERKRTAPLSLIPVKYQLHTLISSYSRTTLLPFQLSLSFLFKLSLTFLDEYSLLCHFPPASVFFFFFNSTACCYCQQRQQATTSDGSIPAEQRNVPLVLNYSPKPESTRGTWWLAVEVSMETGREGRRGTFESSKHIWMITTRTWK